MGGDGLGLQQRFWFVRLTLLLVRARTRQLRPPGVWGRVGWGGCPPPGGGGVHQVCVYILCKVVCVKVKKGKGVNKKIKDNL
jgi:hypothetical protein